MSNWQSEREDYLAGTGHDTAGCGPWLFIIILLLAASLGMLCLSIYYQLSK